MHAKTIETSLELSLFVYKKHLIYYEYNKFASTYRRI